MTKTLVLPWSGVFIRGFLCGFLIFHIGYSGQILANQNAKELNHSARAITSVVSIKIRKQANSNLWSQSKGTESTNKKQTLSSLLDRKRR